MGTDVLVKSGEQTRWFAFGLPWTQPPTGTTALNSTPIVAAATSLPIYKESPWSAFQTVVKGSGAGTLTTTIQATNDEDTGRGYIGIGRSGAGFPINTTAASAAVVSPAGDFDPRMNGAEVVATGVPLNPRTTFTYVSPTTGTLSANATLTQLGAQAIFFNTAWNSTPLVTISITAFPGADGVATLAAPWRYVRAVYSAVTGTITAIQTNMGV